MCDIKNDLIEHGYSINLELNLFQSAEYEDIAYNDGDESENRILNAIKNSVEIDSLSDELEKHCIDWPSTYHLSKRRGNLLRPFAEEFNGKTVLEIGSGMGPITRLLGESGANVLAIEGTSRRAYATRLRTRDLKNVTVVAEKFEDFKTDLKFDIITLIGVLEYSNLYTKDENPHLSVLARCFELLRPNGNLIIAIENKLGLKYFAGANEDHVGIPMFGLENRYTSKSVRTFGKFELKELLSAAGFEKSVFNSPLPDYKLTTSVISESGFGDTKFNSVDLIRDSFGADPQLPASLAFTPELVLTSLDQNNLGLELANSFLVVAGKGSIPFQEERKIAWHFSTNRQRAFCVQTEFSYDASENIVVKKTKMSPEILDGPLAQKVIEKSQYLEGRLLRDDLELLLSTPSWKHEHLKAILNEYKDYLLGFQSQIQTSSGDYFLKEGSIDLIPRNIVISPTQGWQKFDAEWETTSPVDLRQILFRAVLSLHTISHFESDEFGNEYTSRSLFILFCLLLDLPIDELQISEFLNLEVSYHKSISGYSGGVEALKAHIANPLGRGKFKPYLIAIGINERDSAVAERDSAVAERDSAVAERDSAVAERDSAVAERDSAVAERNLILNSTIWRLFSPYRKAINLFRRN
jgi:2-polyprenyl-3-methyl-5-hydroxy-6-metoxy-1,4-benzoquinol methylase